MMRGDQPRMKVGVVARGDAEQRLGRLLAAPSVSERITAPPEAPLRRLLPLAPARRTYGHRVLTVGDAAGLTKPTTGGGIFYSLLSGLLAAETLTGALRRDRLAAGDPRTYEDRLRGRLRPHLQSSRSVLRLVKLRALPALSFPTVQNDRDRSTLELTLQIVVELAFRSSHDEQPAEGLEHVGGARQPRPHAHVAQQQEGIGEMVRGLDPAARSLVEPAETEQRLGGKRAHRELLRQREGLPEAVFGGAGIGGMRNGRDIAEDLEGPRVMTPLLVQEGELQRPLGRRVGALDLPRGQQAFRELGRPEGEIGADTKRLRAAHALLEKREPLVDLAEANAGEAEEGGRDGAPNVENLLAAGVDAPVEEREGLWKLAGPEVDEAGQGLRDGLRIRMARGLGGRGRLVEVLERGVEISQVGMGERRPRRGRHERDAVLDGRAVRRRAAERLEVLAQHPLGLREPSLGVIAGAQVTTSQGLERSVLSRLADPQAALPVLDGQIGLALEVVVVHEVGVDARQARLVPKVLRHHLGFLGEGQHTIELSHLEHGRSQI